MDAFQRRQCNGQRVLPKVLDMDVDSSDSADEMDEGPSSSKKTIDVQAIYNELDFMKRRIQLLQVHLKRKVPQCSDGAYVEPGVLVPTAKTKKIRTLENTQCKLQCQVNDLSKCFCLFKNDVKDVRIRMAEMGQDILELQKLIVGLITWGNVLEEEFRKYIGTFDFLKNLNTTDAKPEKPFNGIPDMFAPEVYLIREKQKFISACKETQKMLQEMLEFQLNRYRAFQKYLHDANRNKNMNNNNGTSIANSTIILSSTPNSVHDYNANSHLTGNFAVNFPANFPGSFTGNSTGNSNSVHNGNSNGLCNGISNDNCSDNKMN